MAKREEPRDPSRREFIKYGVAAAGVAAFELAGYSIFGRQPGSTGALVPLRFNFVDAHNHLCRGLELGDLISMMDSAGVDKTLLMPVFYGGNQPEGQGISDENLVIEWYKKQPDRIIPFFGMQRPILGMENRSRWENPDKAAEDFLKFMDSQLQSKPYKGIGEFIIRHYPYELTLGQLAGDVDLPIDSPLMRRFLDMAARYKLPIDFHYEAEEKTILPLKRILEYKPEVISIWAHCTGRCTPETSRSMLRQYPNLYSDLGGMNSESIYGHVSGVVGGQDPKNPIEDGKGHLRKEWKEVFEEFPDRFVGVGTDLAHPEAWPPKSPQYYWRAVAKFKSLLLDLSDSTAKKISYENAMRIFQL